MQVASLEDHHWSLLCPASAHNVFNVAARLSFQISYLLSRWGVDQHLMASGMRVAASVSVSALVRVCGPVLALLLAYQVGEFPLQVLSQRAHIQHMQPLLCNLRTMVPGSTQLVTEPRTSLPCSNAHFVVP